MLRPRIIPCLLIQNKGLVKTVKFSDSKYVGDPINAVRIFNEKQVDELIVLDISATVNRETPNLKLIENLATECQMPLCYGGGIKSVSQANSIIGLGVEKIAISSAALENPNLMLDIAEKIGRQSVVAVLDIKCRRFNKKYEIWTHNGKVNTGKCPIEFSKLLQKNGVGEIVLNSIDNDGAMSGYDLLLVQKVIEHIKVPVTVLGGAGTLDDISRLIAEFGIIGAAAGSKS